MTILVVDTDPSQVRTVALPLRQRGYRVLWATSFGEAQRLLDAERPQALIADVRLEAYNGLHLLIRARAVRPEVTAIITSTEPDRVLADETRRLDGTFLVKPVKLEDVVAAIERRRFVSSTPRVSLAALVYREFRDDDGAPSIARRPMPPPDREVPAKSARRDSTLGRGFGRGRR